MSLLEIMQEPDPLQLIYGVVNAIVSNTQDPEKLGRVKVTYPVFADLESDWMRIASFYSGKNYGAFFLPAKEDEVLVAFAQGNINNPYMIGCLWNGIDQAPVPPAEQQDVREIKTAGGQVIRFEEKANERITITDNKKNTIVIDTKKGSIEVSCEKNIDITSKQGTITVKGTNIKLEAKSTLSLGANKIDIEAKGTLTLKGSRINLN